MPQGQNVTENRVRRASQTSTRRQKPSNEYTADQFLKRLAELPSRGGQGQDRGSLKADESDEFIGVRMGDIFALARECMNMSPEEIEHLLESPIHEARVGAVSIMDWQARSRSTSDGRRRELFDLYLRRHDRINTWDLVDRSAIYVVGEFLRDKPRDVLLNLARSNRPMERRTAILSTFAFIRRGDVDDAVRIAELLVNDDHDLVQKAVGWMLREVGKKDAGRLTAFLDAHAATMPRVMLRYAIEKLPRSERDRYLAMRRTGS
jgi:3-methyladenine DNA glycosylase AlkD